MAEEIAAFLARHVVSWICIGLGQFLTSYLISLAVWVELSSLGPGCCPCLPDGFAQSTTGVRWAEQQSLLFNSDLLMSMDSDSVFQEAYSDFWITRHVATSLSCHTTPMEGLGIHFTYYNQTPFTTISTISISAVYGSSHGLAEERRIFSSSFYPRRWLTFGMQLWSNKLMPHISALLSLIILWY